MLLSCSKLKKKPKFNVKVKSTLPESWKKDIQLLIIFRLLVRCQSTFKIKSKKLIANKKRTLLNMSLRLRFSLFAKKIG